jgi:hypothetical protein
MPEVSTYLVTVPHGAGTPRVEIHSVACTECRGNIEVGRASSLEGAIAMAPYAVRGATPWNVVVCPNLTG